MDKSPDTYDPRDRPRGGNGAWIASPDTAERDADACRLRAQGKTYDEIAKLLGFANKGHAYNAVSRNLASIRRESAEELRALMLTQLMEAQGVARKIMVTEHPAHSGGKIVRDEDGNAVADPGPRLAAVGRVVDVTARLAKLFGVDAPTQIGILSLEDIQAQIAAAEAEVERLERESGEGE